MLNKIFTFWNYQIFSVMATTKVKCGSKSFSIPAHNAVDLKGRIKKNRKLNKCGAATSFSIYI